MSEPVPEVTAGLAAVRSWCGWHIAPSLSETCKVEGEGSRVLLLPSLFVSAVDEVRNEAGTVIPATDYKWRPNGVVRGCWSREDLYSLDVTHGYETMPAELQSVIDSIDTSGVGQRSATSESAGPFSRTYGTTDLESQPLSVRILIGRYKLPTRP